MNQHLRRAALVAALLALATAMAAAQPAPKWPSSSPPRPLPAREVRFPQYELHTLPNGLQVVVVVHAEQPVVSLRLIVRAGGAEDPAGKPGVAAMVSSLLDQGTTTKSAEQVADTIDSAGGQLDVGVGRDLSWAHVVVMKDGLGLGMGLLADVMRRPAFAEDELARQRKQTLSALQVSYQDPEYVANVVFDRLVYGTNPYGLPGNGTPETIQRLTRDDLVAFHRAYFAPNNCLLAVVGDVTAADALDQARAAFGDWERREVPVLTPADPPDPARRLVVLDKPDAVQTEIRVGQIGIARKNADYLAMDLAIKILGGEGANRLHRILRTERGLTYGASAEAETLKRAGQFVVQTNTRSEATGEVLRLIVDEYWNLRRERVNAGELADAKAYLTGRFPLTIETPDAIATQVLNALFYELPLEELQTYRQRVNAVSVDEVARVAWKYLRPDRLAVVLVGNASSFVNQLKGVGFGKYEVVRLSDLDVGETDFRRKANAGPTVLRAPGGAPWPLGLRGPGASPRAAIPSYAPGSGSTVAQGAGPVGETAQAVLQRAIDAKGGLARLKAVATVEATATTTVMTAQGPVRTETTTYIQYPDRFRVEAHLPIGVAVEVYAGESSVWVQDPTKAVMDVPEFARKDFKASVDRDLIPLLLRAVSGQLKTRLLPKSSGGSDDKVVGVEITGDGIDPVNVFVDAASGLVLRQTYRLQTGGTAEELFTDYRDVNGLNVAFKAAVRRNGLPVLERVLSDFRVNPPLRAGLFEKPIAPAAPGRSASADAKPVPAPAAAGAAPVTAPPTVAPPVSPSPKPPAAPAPKPPAAPSSARPAPAPVSDPEAVALMNKAVAAKGGVERLKAVRTMRVVGTLSAPSQSRQKFDVVSLMAFPDKFRVEGRESGHLTVAVLANDELTLHVQGSGLFAPARGSDADREFKNSVQRDPVLLLQRFAAGELVARVVSPPQGLAQSAERYVLLSGPKLERLVVTIDEATGALLRISYVSPPDSKGPWVDETFSDFRDVNGISIPFRSETRRDGQVLRERVVTAAAVNFPLDPALFDKAHLK
jgi:zinc protease